MHTSSVCGAHMSRVFHLIECLFVALKKFNIKSTYKDKKKKKTQSLPFVILKNEGVFKVVN